MTKEHYITTKGHFRTMCSCNNIAHKSYFYGVYFTYYTFIL